METSDLTIVGVQPVMQSRSRLSVIVFILVFYGGHPRFNYRQCPNLNLRQISESESEALVTHVFSSFDVFEIFFQKNEQHKPSVLQKATP